MRPSASATGVRLCPTCAAAEAIAGAEPVWPSPWRCKTCGHAVEERGGIPLFAPGLADAQTGFDTAVFDELARHEEGHFWFEPRSRLLTGLAAKFFPAAGHYLEIGCGTGVVLKAMAAQRFWSRLAGSELHPAGLSHAIRRLGDQAEFVQMDARHIPACEAFDLIGAFDVLEHIAEDENVLREVHAALVPGGGFIAAVPQHPALWSEADDLAHHVRRYRRGELERKLRSAQFEILFSSSYASVVLPLMAASRFKSRRRAADKLVVHELSVHPFLNAILRAALDVEVSLTLKGLGWPVGGSRIVVARKSGLCAARR
jgi:SAM-dependent methyltransferase